MPRVVTLLSDFGLRDEYAGRDGGRDRRIAPGRARRAPDARHRAAGRAAGRARAGARAALLAGRRPRRGRRSGRRLGAPRRRRRDRGRPAAGRAGQRPAHVRGGRARRHRRGLRRSTNARAVPQPVSRTFHGRDVFAPVAAHLAGGARAVREVGPAVDPATLVRIELPPAKLEPGHVRATAMAIDRFGNVALSVRGAELDSLGFSSGARIEIPPAPAATSRSARARSPMSAWARWWCSTTRRAGRRWR